MHGNCTGYLFSFPLQNYKEAWVGRYLKDHPVPSPLLLARMPPTRSDCPIQPGLEHFICFHLSCFCMCNTINARIIQMGGKLCIQREKERLRQTNSALICFLIPRREKMKCNPCSYMATLFFLFTATKAREKIMQEIPVLQCMLNSQLSGVNQPASVIMSSKSVRARQQGSSFCTYYAYLNCYSQSEASLPCHFIVITVLDGGKAYDHMVAFGCSPILRISPSSH